MQKTGVFAYAKNRFSHDAAQIFLDMFHEVLWVAQFVSQQNVLNHFYNAWLVVLCSWQHVWACFLEFSPFFFCFVFIQFNVPFMIISLISRQANRWVGRNRSTPGKPPGTPTSRTWLVSHVASAGLETYTRHSGEMME